MKQAERKELNAVLDMLLDDEGDHLAAMERLAVLAGRRVRPIVSGGAVSVLEAAVAARQRARQFKPRG